MCVCVSDFRDSATAQDNCGVPDLCVRLVRQAEKQDLAEPPVNPEPARIFCEEAELLSIWTMAQFEARFESECLRALSSERLDSGEAADHEGDAREAVAQTRQLRPGCQAQSDTS